MKLLDFKTTQSSIIKILIEALKEMIVEANIEFSTESVRITKMDNTNTICVILELDTENFKESGHYHCSNSKESPLVVGVSIVYLYRLLKGIDNDDILSFTVSEDNRNVLDIKIENSAKASVKKLSLNLIEINEENLNFPEVDFDTIITYNSSCFQKIIKEMNNLRIKYVDITSYNKQLIFSGTGEITNYYEDTVDEDLQNENNIVPVIKFQVNSENTICQGEYQTSQLMSITKFTNLSNVVTLKMKNDVPLFINYSVGSLGKITILIAPRAEN